MPLWDAALAHGRPLLASPFAAALYPPNLLFALPGVLPARVLTLLAVAHVLWGALGAFVLARRLRSTAEGALTAALLFGFCGATVSAIYMVLLSTTLAWIPWLLVALERALAGRGAPLLACVLVLVLLAGDPFMALSAAIGAAFLLLARRPERPGIARAGLGAAAALVAVSPLLLAMSRYVAATVRSLPMPRGEAVSWSLPPASFLNALFPSLFGDWARGLFDGHGNLLLAGLYVGLAASALALLGASVRAPGRAVLVAWLALQLLLALGHFTPLYDALLPLPLFRSLRYPGKWVLGAALPFALLAARGVDALSREERSTRRLLVATLLLLALPAALSIGAALGLGDALFGLAGSGSLSPDLARELRALLPAIALRAALPLALLAAILFHAARRGRPASGWAAAAIVGADLLASNPPLAGTVTRGVYESPPAAVRAIRADAGSIGRVWVDASPEALAVPSVVGLGGGPDAAARARRERLDGYSGASYGLALAFPPDVEVLSPIRYAQLKEVVESAPPREKLRLLSVAGVTHLVTFASFGGDDAVEVGRLAIGTREPLLVHRNRLALPRVRMVARVVTVNGAEGLLPAMSRMSPEDFPGTALVDARDLPGAGEGRVIAAAGSGGWTLETLRDEPAHLAVSVKGPAGFLVVSDALVPGWRATVDGRPAPLLHAYVAFRAVPVPAGEHLVEMIYRVL